MPTASSTHSRWKTYHLLAASTDALLNDEHRLFAWSVKTVTQGLVNHADYLQRVTTASRSTSDMERRVAKWAAFDVNPVAELILTSPDTNSFQYRWNGYNQLAPLGVNTVVNDAEKALQRKSRCNDADSEFRVQMVTACVNQLSPLACSQRHAPRRSDHARRLLTIRQFLGIRQNALTDVVAFLYESPYASLTNIAATLSCSRRTLQREFTNAAINFRELRQAVRLTMAGYQIRTNATSLTDIAHSSGFFDSAHFTRAWRQSCGITPSDYRALCKPVN